MILSVGQQTTAQVQTHENVLCILHLFRLIFQALFHMDGLNLF